MKILRRALGFVGRNFWLTAGALAVVLLIAYSNQKLLGTPSGLTPENAVVLGFKLDEVAEELGKPAEIDTCKQPVVTRVGTVFVEGISWLYVQEEPDQHVELRLCFFGGKVIGQQRVIYYGDEEVPSLVEDRAAPAMASSIYKHYEPPAAGTPPRRGKNSESV